MLAIGFDEPTIDFLHLETKNMRNKIIPFKFTLYAVTDSAWIRAEEVRENGSSNPLVDCNFGLPTRVLDIKTGSESFKCGKYVKLTSETSFFPKRTR